MLAIIIPAFKPDFLSATLNSLAAQTDSRFYVCIGDDASSHDIASICASFKGKLNIQYHRFEENLGSHDLVAHWERCIALSDSEWIWLFSDDDLASPDCVASFYNYLASHTQTSPLLHFQTDIINEHGQLIRTTRSFPERLSSYDFATGRLGFHWSSFAVEYIFKREHWLNNPFQHFPLAWCSDDASWIKLGIAEGIVSLDGGRVAWRQSTINLSAGSHPRHQEKITAMFGYMRWLRTQFQTSIKNRDAQNQLHDHFASWFFTHLRMMNPLLTLDQWGRLYRELTAELPASRLRIHRELLANQYLACRSKLKQTLLALFRSSQR